MKLALMLVKLVAELPGLTPFFFAGDDILARGRMCACGCNVVVLDLPGFPQAPDPASRRRV
jgi:hypothetical protein